MPLFLLWHWSPENVTSCWMDRWVIRSERHFSDRDCRTVKYFLIKTNAFVRIMFLFCVLDDIRSVEICKTKLYRLRLTGLTDFAKVNTLVLNDLLVL